MSKAKSVYTIVRDGEEKTFDDEGAWRDMQQLLDENDVDYEAHGPSKSDGGKPSTNGENRQSSMMEQQDKIEEQSEESEDAEEEAEQPEDKNGFELDQDKIVPGQDAVKHCNDCGERDHYLYHSGEWVCGGCGNTMDASDATIPMDDNPADKEPDVVESEPEVVEAKPTNPEELSKDPIGFLRSVNSDFVNTIKGTPAISKQGFRFIQREFEISTESEVVKWSDDPLGCVVWAKAELPGGYSAEAHGEGYQSERDVSDNEFVRYADTRAKNRAISDLTSAGALAVSELEE